jgi:hypothetical protein
VCLRFTVRRRNRLMLTHTNQPCEVIGMEPNSWLDVATIRGLWRRAQVGEARRFRFAGI